MIKVDFVMTAVVRPKILKGSLQTIKRYVMRKQPDVDFRLIINVDPVGEAIDPMRVVEVAQAHFKKVVYNIPKEPSFPKAVKWVWSHSTAPYVFHWEDDTMILRRINISHMISILDKYPKLSSLRLYKATTPKRKVFRTFNCRWIQQPEGFYLASDWKKQFGLNPILIKKEFIDEAVKRMRDDTNPEKQFRYSQKYMRDHIKNWKYGLYSKQGEPRIVDGRRGAAWKQKMGLKKPKGITFLKWI